MIKILLADDHRIVTDGIKQILEKKESDIQIVGIAKNGHEVLKILGETEVDLIILDISMPELDGAETTLEVKKKYPKIKILILSMHLEYPIVKSIIHSGVSGYILKNKGYEDLIQAIRYIISGKEFYSEEVVQLLVKKIRYQEEQKQIDEKKIQFTEREIEVLNLLAKGESTPNMSHHMCISVNTVNSHIKNIKSKTEIKTARELIRYAIENGF